MTTVASEVAGGRWRVRRIDAAPVVAVRVWMPGGSRVEEFPGQAQIAGRLPLEGTELRDRRSISLASESIGCSIVAGASSSGQFLALDGLASDWRLILDWTAELLWLASFADDRCHRLCNQGIAELKSLADLPEVLVSWAFLDQLYPGHPLGRPLLGSPQSLARLSADSCRAFHLQCLAEGPRVSVGGQVEEGEVVKRLEALFDRSEWIPRRPRETPPLRPVETRRKKIVLEGAVQAHLCLGSSTVRRSDPDFDAMRLLGVVLGSEGSLAGRLPLRVREREGLSYDCSVTTIAGAGVDRGRFVVSLGTSAGNLERAVAAIEDELDRFLGDGPTRLEVREAKSFLLGRLPFERETAGKLARMELESLIWGLPLADEAWRRSQIEAASAKKLRDLARRYLNPDRLVRTIAVPG